MKKWAIWRTRGGEGIRWYENGNTNTFSLSAPDVFEIVKAEADSCGNWEKDYFRGEKGARREWACSWVVAATDARRMDGGGFCCDADVYQLVCEHYDDDDADKLCKVEVFEISAAPVIPDKCRRPRGAVRMYPWGEKIDPYTVSASVCGTDLHWKLYSIRDELTTLAVTRCVGGRLVSATGKMLRDANNDCYFRPDTRTSVAGYPEWSDLQRLAGEWLMEHDYENGRIEAGTKYLGPAIQWYENSPYSPGWRGALTLNI